MSDLLPDKDSFEAALQMVCGDDIIVRPSGNHVKPDSAVVGFYHSGDSEVSRAFVCDLGFACGSGASLSRVPVGIATDAAKSGKIPENLKENIHEILNIFMSVFETASNDRTVLGDVLLPGRDARTVGVEQAASPKSSVTFDVDLANYGKGAVTLLAL